jgi:hypothetical protein
LCEPQFIAPFERFDPFPERRGKLAQGLQDGQPIFTDNLSPQFDISSGYTCCIAPARSRQGEQVRGGLSR